MARLSRQGSNVILGVFGLGTYLLVSTVVMLKSKGELQGITLVMPKRIEEKRLEAQVAKDRERRAQEEDSRSKGKTSS